MASTVLSRVVIALVLRHVTKRLEFVAEDVNRGMSLLTQMDPKLVEVTLVSAVAVKFTRSLIRQTRLGSVKTIQSYGY